MKRALTYLIVALLSCVSVVAQDTVNAKRDVVLSEVTDKNSFVLINPKWQIKPGLSVSLADGFGGELIVSHYPYSNNWFRVGPALQISHFYNDGSSVYYHKRYAQTIWETRLNLMLNLEFIPSKESSFYIGLDPYVGFQWFDGYERIKYTYESLFPIYGKSVSWYDFGCRFELGGYFGASQRHGMEGHVQFSMNGIYDEHIFKLSEINYKVYVGLAYIFRIE